MFSGDFEAGEFASRGVIIYVDGGSYDGALDGWCSNRGHLDPHASPLSDACSCSCFCSCTCPCSLFSPFHCAPDSHPHPPYAGELDQLRRSGWGVYQETSGYKCAGVRVRRG
jgi:hypothetical protein